MTLGLLVPHLGQIIWQNVYVIGTTFRQRLSSTGITYSVIMRTLFGSVCEWYFLFKSIMSLCQACRVSFHISITGCFCWEGCLWSSRRGGRGLRDGVVVLIPRKGLSRYITLATVALCPPEKRPTHNYDNRYWSKSEARWWSYHKWRRCSYQFAASLIYV